MIPKPTAAEHRALTDAVANTAWTPHFDKTKHGTWQLTVEQLPGFVMYDADKAALERDFNDAIGAELRTYQITGKPWPKLPRKITPKDEVTEQTPKSEAAWELYLYDGQLVKL